MMTIIMSEDFKTTSGSDSIAAAYNLVKLSVMVY